MAEKLLVIRGGAIGDFLLTLPALHALRDARPDGHIEILGYRSIVSVAVGRFYAEAGRSIEFGPLSGFFSRKANLDVELSRYFGSFDTALSYLYDPDEIFQENLKKAGLRRVICGPAKLDDSAHAVYQLAKPLEQMGIGLCDPSLRLYFTDEDRSAAEALLPGEAFRIALHVGSGGRQKVWPPERWLEVVRALADQFSGREWVFIAGEADGEYARIFKEGLRAHPLSCGTVWLENLDLPVLGAALARCSFFLGHDSGISHLAAAAGCKGLLLFGPTDPAVWAPPNSGITVLRAEPPQMEALTVERVLGAAAGALRGVE